MAIKKNNSEGELKEVCVQDTIKIKQDNAKKEQEEKQ